jgi:hypothetical protein
MIYEYMMISIVSVLLPCWCMQSSSLSSPCPSDVGSMLKVLVDRSEEHAGVLNRLSDVLVKLLVAIDKNGTGWHPAPGAQVSPGGNTREVIDMTDEWTAPVAKHRIDRLVKDLKKGRSALYVSYANPI